MPPPSAATSKTTAFRTMTHPDFRLITDIPRATSRTNNPRTHTTSSRAGRAKYQRIHFNQLYGALYAGFYLIQLWRHLSGLLRFKPLTPTFISFRIIYLSSPAFAFAPFKLGDLFAAPTLHTSSVYQVPVYHQYAKHA